MVLTLGESSSKYNHNDYEGVGGNLLGVMVTDDEILSGNYPIASQLHENAFSGADLKIGTTIYIGTSYGTSYIFVDRPINILNTFKSVQW